VAERKINCWEAKNCGREVDGEKINELGICPVSTSTKANGIHGGINGGRVCWVVSGSLCEGEIQGSFADKINKCTKCNFYQGVKKEEAAFKDNSDILYQMKYSK